MRGAITRWNYLLLLEVLRLAPCLDMRNTLVMKPAEQTPPTALALAYLVKEGRFPAGLFNVIRGHGPGVELLHLRRTALTGTIQIDNPILREAAATVKRFSLELKSSLIVMLDAR